MLRICGAAAQVGPGVSRIKADGLRIVGNRLAELAFRDVNRPPLAVRARAFRLKANALRKVGDRVVKVAFFGVGSTRGIRRPRRTAYRD